jgi:pyruvate dehydrogenase E2 component (dihydrolipoamide acetyltransferase)
MMMKSGTIVDWYKKVGDRVEKGERLYAVETEKVTVDVEAVQAGTLLAILAPPGTSIDVFEPVAVIGEPGEPIPDVAKPQTPEIGLPKPAPQAGVTEAYEVIPLSSIRKTIAERLSRSYREAVHLTVRLQADMSQAKSLRETFRVTKGFNPSYTDIIVKASAEVLKNYPMINATYENDELRSYKSVNIAVAVAIEGGLVTPVVSHAEKKSLREISSTIEDLASRAAKGELNLSEVTGGTFTVSNLGMFGIESLDPIINPPQVAILGVGKVENRPVIEGEAIRSKPMVYLSLTFDHRIIDGADAARFLSELKKKLEDISWLKDQTDPS